MDLFLYMVLGLAATWGSYVLYMLVATRASEGRAAAPLFAIFPSLAGLHGRALVYCFSPRCGPCRPMSRDVDVLAASGAPVFKLDITEHTEISRELGIRATPTLIVVEDGAVARMVLGVKTASYMQRLMDAAPA